MQTPIIEFSCISVLGGWRTLVTIGTHSALIGPVFNDSRDLWAWQAVNLPRGA